jgi:hypothetical protein
MTCRPVTDGCPPGSACASDCEVSCSVPSGLGRGDRGTPASSSPVAAGHPDAPHGPLPEPLPRSANLSLKPCPTVRPPGRSCPPTLAPCPPAQHTLAAEPGDVAARCCCTRCVVSSTDFDRGCEAPVRGSQVCGEPYTVTPTSNRVALRLSGPRVQQSHRAELPPEGLVVGAVQVPRGGQPILFLADHPVTGGYPVLAVVRRPGSRSQRSCDRPGQAVRFVRAR